MSIILQQQDKKKQPEKKMKFKLFIKKNAVKKIIDVAEIETDSPITDFAIKSENEIFFSHGHSIGIIDSEFITPFWSGPQDAEDELVFGSIEQSTYLHPSSIFYCKSDRNLYTVENCGRFIRKIEIGTDYTYSIIDGTCKITLDKIFSKSPACCKTSIDIDEFGNIYWSSEIVNRCFKFSGSNVNVLAGNGRAGYSTFNDPSLSHLNFPNGICTLNDSVLISDTNNGLIRMINKKGIFPLVSNLKSPRNIQKIDKRLVFIDGDSSIKTVSLDGKTQPFEIYKGNEIVNIHPYGSDIYVMEKII